MKTKIALATLFIALCSNAYATDALTNSSASRWAIQSVMVSGGNFGIGIANYSDTTEFGATISATFNNANNQTSIFTPAVFGGWRKSLRENTFFAFGFDLVSNIGKEAGENIDTDIMAGPYISLEQQLTSHLLLLGWIVPYQYEYKKINCEAISTNSFFNSGGIGFSYLF